MMRIAKFEASHLENLTLQPGQSKLQETIKDKQYAENLARSGPAFTVFSGDNVVACCGLIEQWKDRAICWALLSTEAGKCLVGIHRATDKYFNLMAYRRIETAVATEFEEGHRWVKLLGFEREGTMKAYAPDGSDHDLYARIAK